MHAEEVLKQKQKLDTIFGESEEDKDDDKASHGKVLAGVRGLIKMCDDIGKKKDIGENIKRNRESCHNFIRGS